MEFWFELGAALKMDFFNQVAASWKVNGAWGGHNMPQTVLEKGRTKEQFYSREEWPADTVVNKISKVVYHVWKKKKVYKFIFSIADSISIIHVTLPK